MGSVESGNATCQYDTSPDVALAAVKTYEGPVLVDLDETLYLRNSTEDFISCAWPGLLALLVLKVLDLLKPWRLTGGTETRDTWRVRAISVFLPWTRWLWLRRVQSLAEGHVNRDLRTALKARAQPPIILTVGFKSIVAPLLVAMGFGDARLVAARMSSFADRGRGKLHLATRELGSETLGRSMMITDSINDLEVLRSCARPLRTIWPEASYRPALSNVYLPGEYISRIKHPGERYIVRGIVQEDFAFWLLSSVGLAVNPATHFAGLVLLLLSFWTIYERGYVENDLAALHKEADPNLSASFGRVTVATPALQPWIWALLAGAAGVAILHPDVRVFAVHLALWIAVLICTYACFLSYNALDKQTRVWLYPLLQFARGTAFVAVVPIEAAGVAALGAFVVSRWVPYAVYRSHSDSNWPNMRPELIRLIAFVLLSVLIACSFGLSSLIAWGSLALLLWSLFRARRDLWAVLRSAHRLDTTRNTATKDRRRVSGSAEGTTP